MKATKRRLRAAVLWAMMPLALVGARPSGGCICADGHYEPVCMAQQCRGRAGASGNSASPTACCGCSCCRSAGQQTDCCIHRTCCSTCSADSTQDESTQAGWRATRSCCCHPVPATPTVATVKTVELEFDAALNVDLLSSIAITAQAQHGRVVQAFLDTGPPPDLVLTLQRLLI